MAGSDYNAISSTLEFPVNSTSGDEQCINITIVDDNDVEGDEMFTVTLERIIGAVTLSQGTTVVTITDNEGG